MDGKTKPRARIAVIGGGISGLSAAYYLGVQQSNVRVVLLEASDRLGGVIHTTGDGQYVIERAADNFLRGPTAPWAEKLCEEIGLSDQLIPTSDQNRGAHIYWNGRLHKVPAGFQLMAPARMWPIMTSSLLSPWGRLRLSLEPFVREPRQQRDETITEFARRRLGQQALDRLVQPLVSGIYTADPDRLSVAAALPQMVQMVRQHGSLYRAMRCRQRQTDETRETRGARYSLFVTPRHGMSSLIDALAERLKTTEIRRQSRVDRIRPAADGGWSVFSSGEMSPEPFDAVVVALPANRAAPLFGSMGDSTLADELAGIDHASCAIVCCGYPRCQIKRPLDAFGCVVPAAAGRRVVAVSYSSIKYSGRAPSGSVLLRVFVGGAMQEDLAELPEPELVRLVRQELAEIIGAEGPPEICHVIRWLKTMPQYEVGHLDRVARIERLVENYPGLQLAGNGLTGVGIPQCVRRSQLAAQRIIEYLASGSSDRRRSPRQSST